MQITNSKDHVRRQLKNGLVLFAQRYQITPAQFAKVMDYSYQTAWDLLRGKKDFTPEALGRFVLKYGTLNAAKMLRLAQLPDGVAEVSLLDGPADAMPVLLVTTEA